MKMLFKKQQNSTCWVLNKCSSLSCIN